MKDFFRVMGKAFAVVFGSTSALALVLVLLVLALRPLLRSWLEAQQPTPAPVVSRSDGPPPGYREVPPPAGSQQEFTNIRPIPKAKGKAVPYSDLPPGFIPYLFLRDCNKDACAVYDSLHHLIGNVPRDEITKAQWIPVDEHRK